MVLVDRVVHIATGAAVSLLGLAGFFKAWADLDFLGTNGEPGPGLFPMLLSAILFVLGLLLIFTYIAGTRRSKDQWEELHLAQPALMRAGAIWLAFAVTVGMLPLLGFLLSSVLLIAFLVFVMERLHSVRNGLAMLALPFGIYVLFSVLLEVRLPAGIFAS